MENDFFDILCLDFGGFVMGASYNFLFGKMFWSVDPRFFGCLSVLVVFLPYPGIGFLRLGRHGGGRGSCRVSPPLLFFDCWGLGYLWGLLRPWYGSLV